MTWVTMSQRNAPVGALPKVTWDESARLKYLSTIAVEPVESHVLCSASPVSIWWPETRISMDRLFSLRSRVNAYPLHSGR